MRDILWGWGAVVLALGLAGPGRAQEPPGDGPRDLNPTVIKTLGEVHNRGADLYNGGDANGCYRLMEGSLLTVKPLLAHRPDVQKAIEDGLAAAEQNPRIDARAFLLHRLIVDVRNKLKEDGADAKADRGPVAGKPAPKKPATLWDRLGGEEVVRRVVDDFVASAAADPKVNFDRGGRFRPTPAELKDLKEKMIDLVSQATGGPRKYTGQGMKEVHKGMNITEPEFDAAAAHLEKALRKNNVPPGAAEALMEIVAATKDDIVQAKRVRDSGTRPKGAADKGPPDDLPPGEQPPRPDDRKPGKPADGKAAKKPEKQAAGPVTLRGRVTYKGKPLADGTVSFHAPDGTVVSAETQADGSYEVKGLTEGPKDVSIKHEGPKGKSAIPAKYASPKTSGLKVEAEAGEIAFDLLLQ